jgi:2,4-dienoyl-CoA reductase-like NADH-dependent reductase (Old Yellow Enzyme family)/thioredoxin reductase
MSFTISYNSMIYSSLFSPGKIGSLEIKNRVVMPPMVRNYADENGLVTPKYVAHIDRVARGGVGMMILEASFIRQDGKGFVHELGLHTDDVIPGIRQLVDAAHSHSAVIGPQLYHAGRQTSSKVTGMQPVAPYPLPDPTINELPRPLSMEEIREIVDAYAQAARRAKEAGCDFVEIHGAHGHLITQFLSPYSNLRTDAYGGSEEGRMRFPSEVYQAVRKAVGPEFPVTMRISANEMVMNGLTLEDSAKIAKELEKLGVDAIDVSSGNYASFNQGYMITPMSMPDGLQVPFAEWIKSSVKIPVIAVGKIRSPAMADDVIRTGKADFVAIGRSLLADPDWPKKAQDIREEQIRYCIACNEGCITRLFSSQDVWCTVNPETGHEEEFALLHPEAKKRVLIAGGGPAGMEAARIAALRGHRVMLFEQRDHLGGALLLASMLPQRPGWNELRDYLVGEMNRLGVDVRLRTKATAEIAKESGAEVAVVAIGASQAPPDIPGIESKNVVLSRDLLEGTARVRGDNVVVLGGGTSGALIADFLAQRMYKITIVTSGRDIAKDAPVVVRDLLLDRLRQCGVEMLTDTRIIGIESDNVLIVEPGGTEALPGRLPADTVVASTGARPNDSLADELRRVVEQVFVVGDAVEPRDVTYAMLEGARAGLV